MLSDEGAAAWRLARWPGAVAAALLVFSFVYYVTPDVKQRAFRWITPGAAVDDLGVGDPALSDVLERGRARAAVGGAGDGLLGGVVVATTTRQGHAAERRRGDHGGGEESGLGFLVMSASCIGEGRPHRRRLT